MPDIIPRDYCLFLILKKLLGGRVESNEKVIDAVNSYFKEFEVSYHKNGVTKLESLLKKCISLSGNYVKKLKKKKRLKNIISIVNPGYYLPTLVLRETTIFLKMFLNLFYIIIKENNINV